MWSFDDDYEIKGVAEEQPSGVNRASEDGKIDYTLLRDGPLYERWAAHLTRAIPVRGRRNWMLANTPEDRDRFMRSATRHFEQWLKREKDEDHAAATIFNMNGVEYVEGLLVRERPSIEALEAALNLVADYFYESGMEIGELVELRRFEMSRQ